MSAGVGTVLGFPRWGFALEATRVRSTAAWTWRTMLTAMCQHIDAWHAAGALQGKDPVNSWRADISPTA